MRVQHVTIFLIFAHFATSFVLPPVISIPLETSVSPNYIPCERIENGQILCQNVIYATYVPPVSNELPLFQKLIYGGVSILLVLIAGLMSGLTLGLMSLDRMDLEILMQSGTDRQKKHAGRILPLLDYHHWLLVTLLLCNSAAMEALPLFLDKLVSEYIAIIISVTAVLLFGEIIPQSICCRFGMAVGSKTAWLVRVLMWLTLPISWPIGKVLDLMFGSEAAQKYQRHELKELVNQHGLLNEGPLTADECSVIMGAIDLQTKTVSDCMTPIGGVFMVDVQDVIDKNFIDKVNLDGHSRVPVFQGNRNHVVGLLYVKKLVGIDIDGAHTVRDVMRPKAPIVPEDKGLYEQLNHFQTGRSHMAVVWNFEQEKVSGIITLEDLIEELIQGEIEDEADVRRKAATKTPVPNRKKPTEPPKSNHGGKFAFLTMSARFGSPALGRRPGFASPLVVRQNSPLLSRSINV